MKYVGQYYFRSIYKSRQKDSTNLGAEAVSDSSDMLDTHVLEGLDALDSDGVNVFLCMRVIAVRALVQPLHQVEAGRAIQQDRVAVE